MLHCISIFKICSWNELCTNTNIEFFPLWHLSQTSIFKYLDSLLIVSFGVGGEKDYKEVVLGWSGGGHEKKRTDRGLLIFWKTHDSRPKDDKKSTANIHAQPAIPRLKGMQSWDFKIVSQIQKVQRSLVITIWRKVTQIFCLLTFCIICLFFFLNK